MKTIKILLVILIILYTKQISAYNKPKSLGTAQFLNLILPGAGSVYLGDKTNGYASIFLSASIKFAYMTKAYSLRKALAIELINIGLSCYETHKAYKLYINPKQNELGVNKSIRF